MINDPDPNDTCAGGIGPEPGLDRISEEPDLDE